MPNIEYFYLNKGLFLYDRFMLEFLIIIKTKTDKIYHYVVNSGRSSHKIWLANYYTSLTNLLSLPNTKIFYSKNIQLQIIWEICNIFLALSQADYISFQELTTKETDMNIFKYFGQPSQLATPTSYESAIIFLFCTVIELSSSKPYFPDPSHREEPKYDDTNIFDLKLQEFFVIAFTSIKVELHEHFKNLIDNKFPKLLVVFNETIGGKLGSLKYYSKFFSTNHDVNFKASLAFLLYENNECLRCESILKQILEKEVPNLQMKLFLIYKLGVLLFTDKTLEYKKALLYSKEALNLFTKFPEKKSMDYSQMYFMHAMVYFKLAGSSNYETQRVAMKSNAFDYLKISLELDSDNYWAKLIKGIMLLDITFKEKEGLKLIQEVNADVPNRMIPMLALALAFSYCRDIDRALVVLKDSIQRFHNISYICYVFLAHLRAQEVLQKQAEENPLLLEFKSQGLQLNDPDSRDMESIPLFQESQIWEIELIMKKAVTKLLSDYNIPSEEQGLNCPRISDLVALKFPPEGLLNYEQVILYWAKLLINIEATERIEEKLNVFDTTEILRKADLFYIRAVVAFRSEDYLKCNKLLREAVKQDPLHQEAITLLASLHFKNKELMSETEGEALVMNALSLYETREALELLAKYKRRKNENEAELELLLRAFNLTNSHPLFKTTALDLYFSILTG